MNLAIIGATGNVGRKTIEILEKSEINNDQIHACIKMILSQFYNYFKNNIAAQKIVFHNNFSPTFNNKQLKEIGNVILKKLKL